MTHEPDIERDVERVVMAEFRRSLMAAPGGMSLHEALAELQRIRSNVMESRIPVAREPWRDHGDETTIR